MNTDWLVRQFVRAAEWQLARRAPTWALIAIVGVAFMYALAHGAAR